MPRDKKEQNMKNYKFHKSKYGEELLIDVVTLDSISKYISKYPLHTLSYFDITFITSGKGTFTLDNEQYSLAQGDVIFSMPGEIRVWDLTDMPQGYALIFEEEFLLSFFNDPLFIQNLSFFNAKRVSAKININPILNRIDDIIQCIQSEINNDELKDKHILRALLYEALMLLNREYSKSQAAAMTAGKPQNRYVNCFIELTDKYFRVHHDTKYYADNLCITPNYLNEIVQKHIGVNAKTYIQSKIIKEAKRQLSYTNLSVSEIAESLHFESTSYFIRLFRQQTQLTPLQYRQSNNR